uniref:Uncharacterized protein n=1 Tax=Crocodylus porosus TaxID=8502 RepID=A0A7M4G1Q7_CROPO
MKERSFKDIPLHLFLSTIRLLSAMRGSHSQSGFSGLSNWRERGQEGKELAFEHTGRGRGALGTYHLPLCKSKCVGNLRGLGVGCSNPGSASGCSRTPLYQILDPPCTQCTSVLNVFVS